MKREEVKPIKELLGAFIREMGLERGLNEARISVLWDELLGPVVASSTQQKRLKDGTFFVRVNSSVVRNYLFTQRTGIADRINKAMGQTLVTDIILN